MPHRAALALLAVALSLAAPAADAQSSSRRARAQRKPAPAARPVSTAPRLEQAPGVAALVGVDRANGHSGLGLRVDGEVPLAVLGPRALLSGVGSLGFSWFSEHAGDFSATTLVFRAVPAARLTVPLVPRLAAYGDAGAGAYVARSSLATPGFGTSVTTGVGFTLRFAAGLHYDLTDRFRIGAEVDVSPFFGDWPYTMVGLGLVATLRL